MLTTDGERFNSGVQSDFSRGERFETPSSLDTSEQYESATRFLNQEKMWREHFLHQRDKRNLRCIAVDFEQGTALDFNPLTWQADRADLVDSHQPPENLSGLLIKTKFKRLEAVANYLQTMTPLLPPKSPVIVVEEKGPKYRQGLEKREDILEQSGLVKRSILIRPSRKKDEINDYILWRSRVAVDRKGEPVNLLDDGPEWRKNWIKAKIQKAAQKYRQAEVNPINAYEIGEQLRNSKNPPQDIGAAELGFGFQLELLCGCQVKTTVRGAWMMVKDCPEFPECEGDFLR